jgi:hypothetical protein
LAQGIDALVIVLAPVFAAGFGIQKFIEIIDYIFYALSGWIITRRWSFINKRIIDKDPKSKGAIEEYNATSLKLLDADTKLKGLSKTDDSGLQTAKNSVGEAANNQKNAKKKLDESTEEVRKILKTFLIGVTSIALAVVIVWFAHMHVLATINEINTNATTGSNAASATTQVNSGIDFWITVLFVASGTEGINSILKYFGYAKEKKDAEAKKAESKVSR